MTVPAAAGAAKEAIPVEQLADAVHQAVQQDAGVAMALRVAVELARGQSGRLVDAPDLRTAMFRFHQVASVSGLVAGHASQRPIKLQSNIDLSSQ